MLRKILAVVLVMTMLVLFAACGDKKEEETTLNPLLTGYSPISTSSQPQGSNANGVTYILTTNQSKTVPALSTTRFNPTPVTPSSGTNISTNPSDYNNVSYTTASGVITVPPVSTTRTIPTTWETIPTTTTIAPTTTTTTLPRVTTTRPTTQPTTKAEPMGMDVVQNDSFVDTQGRLCITIDSNGWGGAIKSNSQRIPVYIDNMEMEKSGMLQISSATTGDGYQYVYLDLSEYEIGGGVTVSFVIPEGFLENKVGTKYNYSYEVSQAIN